MKKALLFISCIACFQISFSQVNLQLLGHLPFATTCAGVWQYVDSLGNEYALIGAGDGIAIVDVTVPANPVLKFTVPAANSLWREIKTHSHYCYATTEGGGGVTIVNLQYLPDSVQSKVYTGDGVIAGQLGTAHTCQVTDGYLYIFGSDIGVGGAIIADLNNDPWNPEYVGIYDLHYIHDGYIRNDTLWAGEIYEGQFSVIDVTDKTNPVLVATQATPGAFCHNTWLSDNSQFLFTTDEVNGAPMGSFDVSDVSNIQMVDTYFTDSMPNEEVHNVHVLNDFLICPSYGSQLTIVDGTHPDNLVEIASYPTGNFLCWDASPYLPSGNIIATDVGGGLYIFAPYYVQACYLEGNVTDSITNFPLNNVTVRVLSTPVQAQSVITGDYKTGSATAGTFDVEFSKPGYITKIITGVTLNNGIITQLDVELASFIFSGQVVEASTGNPVSNSNVRIKVNTIVIDLLTDVNGNFSTAAVNSGNGEIIADKWGFVSECINVSVPSASAVILQLPTGIYDDFTFDYGWTVSGNALNGMWERGEPVGTMFSSNTFNPDFDVTDDCSIECYVTGNAGGGFNDDDVDDGYTQIISPVFDLTSYSDPYLNYERWFYGLGSANSGDTLFITLSNGSSSAVVEMANMTSPSPGTWQSRSFRISDFISPTSTMHLTVYIEDKTGSQSPLECGFDKFQISEGPLGLDEAVSNDNGLFVFPNPFVNELKINTAQLKINNVSIYDMTGRKVYEIEKDKFQSETLALNVSSLQQGTYILKVITDTNILSAKIFKM
ncbi:MAG TPA: choice-of-anchor B family protein [Bacteroidia bacterium]|nr:choice-of-anchor B family protein [Bacteroidia bacterium]